MKSWLIFFALAGVFAQAQDQSVCPGPRHVIRPGSCGPDDVKREVTVHVLAIDAGDGPASGGYYPTNSKVSAATLADVVALVEGRQYRACDMGPEIIDRVRVGFQHLGYFCADIEPLKAEKVGKLDYRININVHPGEKYRVAEVKFTGATQISLNELQSDFHIKPNAMFDEESVRRGIEKLQKLYAKKGYPNVSAVPVAFLDEQGHKMTIEIKIQEATSKP